MGVYKRPLRSDELYHSTIEPGRNNLTYRLSQINKDIIRYKEILANPNPREKVYLDVYRRKLDELYAEKKKYHDRLKEYNAKSAMKHSSDELMHWGRKGFHKYIAKIGNRYFYTQEEVQAYKLAQVEGGIKNAKHKEQAEASRQRAADNYKAASDAAREQKDTLKEAKKANRKATYAWKKEDRDAGLSEYNHKTHKAEALEDREAELKRTARANEKVAQTHDERAQKVLDDAKRKQENITKDKSLITQMAFKRAVEKDDREKEKKAKRETGKKKVQDWFRKKGWIY